MAKQVIEDVKTWLEQVVIGLNLCPFAQKPHRQGAIHYHVFEGNDDKALLATIYQELEALEKTPIEERETSLLITPDYLSKFDDYNQFLGDVEWMLERAGWEGTFQVASFHPDYQFAGTLPDDAENLTNRSPYPIFHLLREESLAAAIERFPDTDEIPDTNIKCMNQLSPEKKRQLFPYLFSK